MARVKLMISDRVRKEFSSSGKQAKAEWFAPSLSLWKAEQRCPVAQAMVTTPVIAASDSCRVRSPQACPSDCVESPCAHWVSAPALKRVRKALESSGTSASMPSLSHSERYLWLAFLMHEREPT